MIQLDAPHPLSYRPDLPLRGVLVNEPANNREAREQTSRLHAECDKEIARLTYAVVPS